MKKILIIVVLFLVIVSIVIYANNKEIFIGSYENKFEQKVREFRFSLNEELQKYDQEKIMKFDFDKNSELFKKIDKFIFANKKEIKEYKKYIFQQNENSPEIFIDTNRYEKLDMGAKNDDMFKVIQEKNSLYQLLFIHPLYEIVTYEDVYLSTSEDIENFTVYKVKGNITTPLIKTKKIDKNRWEIIKNNYDFITKCVYDLDKEMMVNFEIFKLKI